MNYLKRLVLIIFGLVVLTFLISLFIPSTCKIEKSININAKSELLFKQIETPEKINVWSVWQDKTIEVRELVPNQSVVLSTNFGYDDTKEVLLITELDNEVQLTWAIELNFGFNPITKMSGLFIDEEVNDILQQELEKLKGHVENLPQINSSKVEKRLISENMWYLSIRDTIDQMQMNNIHGKLYSEINTYMDDNNINSDLPPIVTYHFWSDTLVDIEAGIQIKDSVQTNDARIKLNKLPIGSVVSATHYGSYERLPETYFSINEWMRKNQVEILGPPWEIYITDPGLESNPEKWETQINFPIK